MDFSLICTNEVVSGKCIGVTRQKINHWRASTEVERQSLK
jgi:hypothetical protein